MTDLSERMCAWCGRLFKPDRATARFCCSAHAQSWHYWRRKQLQQLGKRTEAAVKEPHYE